MPNKQRGGSENSSAQEEKVNLIRSSKKGIQVGSNHAHKMQFFKGFPFKILKGRHTGGDWSLRKVAGISPIG